MVKSYRLGSFDFSFVYLKECPDELCLRFLFSPCIHDCLSLKITTNSFSCHTHMDGNTSQLFTKFVPQPMTQPTALVIVIISHYIFLNAAHTITLVWLLISVSSHSCFFLFIFNSIHYLLLTYLLCTFLSPLYLQFHAIFYFILAHSITLLLSTTLLLNHLSSTTRLYNTLSSTGSLQIKIFFL